MDKTPPIQLLFAAMAAGGNNRSGKGHAITYRRIKAYRANRNDPCPCKSGRKFKKCCINKIVLLPIE